MIERGLLGAKTGQGFYKRVTSGGESRVLTLDLATMEYREPREARFPSLDATRAAGDSGSRIRYLFLGSDRVA